MLVFMIGSHTSGDHTVIGVCFKHIFLIVDRRPILTEIISVVSSEVPHPVKNNKYVTTLTAQGKLCDLLKKCAIMTVCVCELEVKFSSSVRSVYSLNMKASKE